MNSIKNIFFVSVICFLFTSCKNDLKLNAPYKEYPSIYAVLTPQDKIQMIRINKVFLGEGDANKMAQVADSVNYPAGELTVTLERYINGLKANATNPNFPPTKDIITFHDSVITTDAGAFSTTQRIYVTGEKLCTDGEYVLKVTNNKTKNVFTARSNALDSIKPNAGPPPFQAGNYYGDPANITIPDNKTIFIDYGDPSPSYALRFKPNSAIIYQVNMRLHYFDSMVTGIKNFEYVDFPFTRQNGKDAIPAGNQGPYVTNIFKCNDILNAVASSLAKKSAPVANITGRKLYKIGFMVYSSSQDYLDYLEFASPSLSIAQEKPLYSNFENRAAIGIFAFRSRYHISREVHKLFVDRLAISSITCKYKFFDQSNILPLCQ